MYTQYIYKCIKICISLFSINPIDCILVILSKYVCVVLVDVVLALLFGLEGVDILIKVMVVGREGVGVMVAGFEFAGVMEWWWLG